MVSPLSLVPLKFSSSVLFREFFFDTVNTGILMWDLNINLYTGFFMRISIVKCGTQIKLYWICIPYTPHHPRVCDISNLHKACESVHHCDHLCFAQVYTPSIRMTRVPRFSLECSLLFLTPATPNVNTLSVLPFFLYRPAMDLSFHSALQYSSNILSHSPRSLLLWGTWSY